MQPNLYSAAAAAVAKRNPPNSRLALIPANAKIREQIHPIVVAAAPSSAAAPHLSARRRAMTRGTVFMNPLHDLSDSFASSLSIPHKPTGLSLSARFPRSASCHSRSLSPHLRSQRSVDMVEIPSSWVSIHESVGKGYFGYVYRGQLREPGSSHYTAVAVKSLKSRFPPMIPSQNLGEILHERGNTDDFLAEGLIMRALDHPNVMRLLGICYSSEAIPSLIMPFMHHGDLRTYVGDPYRQVCVIEVVDFAQQIAEGMAYLSAMGIVHRDLAARNCMLNDNYVVKIADFGLAVDLSRDHHLSRRDNHPFEQSPAPLRLALKWLPIEVLRNRRCVHTSVDTWSFGVVIWELMTRACAPYDELSNSDLEWFLSSGKRLPQPFQCPAIIYEIMISCWRPNPTMRPRFSALSKQLGAIMNHEIEHARRFGRSGAFFHNLPCGKSYKDVYPSVPYS